MTEIVLATLNARYEHASLALRCLLANLGALRGRAHLVEGVCGVVPEAFVERLLEGSPRIVAFSVYVWNVDELTRITRILRRVAPDVSIVVGGPEVSHETDEQVLCRLADFVVTGPGELAFAGLCRALLDGPRPLMRVITGGEDDLALLASPYPYYEERDLASRNVYVEASRGCPYRCEFCLSALDRNARPFPLEPLLASLDGLHRRGARRFKFIDRTFNLNPRVGRAILEFFLERQRADDPCFAHFELVPDRLPESLREPLGRFAAGTLQLEIGIQTFDPAVQATISRRQDNDRSIDNLRWLRRHTNAHLHVDLIAGLPGEDLDGFAAGFDRLVALGPHEIQVGILKRLRGAPIARHTGAFDLRFNPDPPYNLLASDRISFADMQRITRFARYWDLFANSGRFAATMPLVLDGAPFSRFMAFSDWMYRCTDATNRLSLERRFVLLHRWLVETGAADGGAAIEHALRSDYARHSPRGVPPFLRPRVTPQVTPQVTPPVTPPVTRTAAPGLPPGATENPALPKRQARHIQAEKPAAERADERAEERADERAHG